MTIKRTNFIKGIRLKPTDDALSSEGDISVSKTAPKLKAKVDGSDRDIVTEDQDQTLLNKTIDSASNTITIDADVSSVSNIKVSDLKAGVLDIDLTTASVLDDTIPSAKATKTYIDTQIAGKDEASEISYDNTASGLVATNVQTSIDEVEGRVDSVETSATAAQSSIDNHIADAVDAHDASAISNVASGNLIATDVQGALNELQTELDGTSSSATAAQAAVDAHIVDAVDAHDASAISNVASGNLVATDVQGALNELQTELDGKAVSSEITDHITAVTGAHSASAVTNVPSGSLAATTVQGALDELQTDIDSRALDSSLTSHISDTVSHGTVGDIVGTSDVQTLTNKSIQSPSRLDPKKDTKANLDVYATTAQNGEFVYATDQKVQYQVKDGGLSLIGGGGGGLDVFHTQDLNNISPSDYVSTGNDSTFSGAGTLNGTVVDETVNPIAGDKSHKYTAGAASQNDFIEIATITLAAKQKGTQVKELIYADMSNFSKEVEIVVWDVTNSKKLNLDADVLKPNQKLSKYEVIFNTESTTAEISYGFHMIEAPVNTEFFIFDDFEFTNDVFSKAGFTSTQSLRLNGTNGYGSTNTAIRRFTNITSEIGSGIFDYTTSATLGNAFTAKKKCQIVISWKDHNTSVSGGEIGFSVNSNQLTTNILSIDANSRIIGNTQPISSAESGSISTSVFLEIGDILRCHGSVAGSSTALVDNISNSMSITATAISENVISSVVETGKDIHVKASGNAGEVIISNVTNVPFIEIEDSNNVWDGSVMVADSDSVLNFSGQIRTATLISGQVRLYVNGLFDSVLNNTIAEQRHVFSGTVRLLKGDEMSIRFSASTLLNDSFHTLTITKQALGNHMLALPVSRQNRAEFHIKSLTNGGVPIVNSSNADWLTTPTDTATGDVFLNFKAGEFSVPPIVIPAADSNGRVPYAFPPTTSGVRILCERTTDGVDFDIDFNVMIAKQGTDYTPEGVHVGQVARERIAYISDEKPSGTQGGTSLVDTTHTRDLNTLRGDTDFISLAANQFELSSEGDYDLDFTSQYFRGGRSQLFIYNVTDSTYELEGLSSNGSSSVDSNTAEVNVRGRISITTPKTFEVRHYIAIAKATNGLGAEANGTSSPNSVEVYTSGTIRKIR